MFSNEVCLTSDPKTKFELIDRTIALGLVFAFSALYWLGRSTTFGAGDSPQHVLSAITWGVSWPPSYPLYVLIGHIVSKFPGSPAGNVNWLSGLLHAASYGLFFLTLRRCRIQRLPGTIAVVALGLSPLFWYYSLNAEVRALNDLLAVAAAYFAIGWINDHDHGDLAAMAIAVGLGTSHHPTYLLIVPALIALTWPTITLKRLGAFILIAVGTLAVPYVILGLRVAYGHPAYDLVGVSRFTDVIDLFLRKDLGGPFRVVAGQGILSGGFDTAWLLTYMKWFVSALTTTSAPVVLSLSAFGFAWCCMFDRRSAAFWGLWLLVSAFTFIVLGSQQLHLHDPDFAYSIAARFYLLPTIPLYAFVAYGADVVVRHFGVRAGQLLLVIVIAIPILLDPVTLRHKDVVYEYTQEMISETGPTDMIILDTDATFFALSYLDLVEHRLEDRALVMPSLFYFPPYREWLQRRYPTLKVPPVESMMDWASWRTLNPTRKLYGEMELQDSLQAVYPYSEPAGALIRACEGPAPCVDRDLALRRLERLRDEMPATALYPFSPDIYVPRHLSRLLGWSVTLARQ